MGELYGTWWGALAGWKGFTDCKCNRCLASEPALARQENRARMGYPDILTIQAFTRLLRL